jgi:hypothetical protein
MAEEDLLKLIGRFPENHGPAQQNALIKAAVIFDRAGVIIPELTEILELGEKKPSFEIDLTDREHKGLLAFDGTLQKDRNIFSNIRNADLSETGRSAIVLARQELESVSDPVFRLVEDLAKPGAKVGFFDPEGRLSLAFQESEKISKGLVGLYPFPRSGLPGLFKAIGIDYSPEQQDNGFQRKYKNGEPIVFTRQGTK